MACAIKIIAAIVITFGVTLGTVTAEPVRPIPVELVDIPGGQFMTGDAQGEPDEAPQRETVASFWMMKYEVTNAAFAAFVASTGYRTDVEDAGFGYLWDEHWRRGAGANWRHPFGLDGGIEDKRDHPVVQVSARDAAAFCAWLGLRLPSEAEWEFAARGTDQRRYPWGNDLADAPAARQANFGTLACCAADASDGYLHTAPVGSYPAGASPFGLLDMAGNVWEWTSSRFPGKPHQVVLRGGGWGNNPYCLRTSYRHGNPPDIGLSMVGFRCAGDRR